MSADPPIVLVLPSLKISGGTLQALRLARHLSAARAAVSILAMWHSPYPVDTAGLDCRFLSKWRTNVRYAPFQYFFLVFNFARMLKGSGDRYIFTHFATFPLMFCVARNRRWAFVQDLEWTFVSKHRLASIVRSVILFCLRRSAVISANDYLTSAMTSAGVKVQTTAAIWADAAFGMHPETPRVRDVMIILRRGAHKNIAAYPEFARELRRRRPALTMVAVSTENDLLDRLGISLVETAVRPNAEIMLGLYATSRVFVLLSDHEGFGLPPLEAMGGGCVPVCRDSGGPRAYMTGVFADLLIDRRRSIAEIADLVIALLDDGDRWQRLSDAARATFQSGLAEREKRVVKLPETELLRRTS